MPDRSGGLMRLHRWLLPAGVRLTRATRFWWVAIGTVAAGAIGWAAILGALRFSTTRGLVVPSQLPTLLWAVPLSAAVTTGAGVAWILRPAASRRSVVGVWVGIAVAVLSHPLAWGLAAAIGGGAEWSSGVLAVSTASLRAVGWVTVPLCALGGYWTGRRFDGAICP
jgi:hypothetical protein